MSTNASTFVTDHLRTHDFDWYAALLFAPADKRATLASIFAFLAEIGRIRSLISDPMAGEIRLQWWRDALTGDGHGDVRANPLAAGLLDTISTYNLPVEPLQAAIDAYAFDLYDDPMPSITDFEGYAGETLSGPLALAATVLAGVNPASVSDCAGHGGVALTVVRVLNEFPLWSHRGQWYLPPEIAGALDRSTFEPGTPTPELSQALAVFAETGLHHLQKARDAQQHVDPKTNPLWLPFGIAEKILHRATRWARDPYAKPLKPARWQRLYQLWRASKQ